MNANLRVLLRPEEAVAFYLRALPTGENPAWPADCAHYEESLREVKRQFDGLAPQQRTEDMLLVILGNYPDLLALVSDMKTVGSSAESIVPPAQEEEDFPKFLDFKDLRSLPKPEWLLYDILPTKGITFFFGKPKCGKTYVSIGMACAIASNLDWLGRATKHGHVVYIAAEDIDEVAQRVLGWADYHHQEDIPNLHFFPCPLRLATDTPKFMTQLKKQYGDLDIVLFVVDTLAMCSMGVDENAKKEFDAVISSLESLWRTYNCCVLAIHHAGKNGEMRGTSSIDGVAYNIVKVSEVDENVMLENVAKRRGKKFEDIYLDREIVCTGDLDEEGNPVSTCVLVKSDRSGSAESAKLTHLQEQILQHLKNFGGVNVARTELLKASTSDPKQERSFINAISGLIGKGYITMTKERQRVKYSFSATYDIEQFMAEQGVQQ